MINRRHFIASLAASVMTPPLLAQEGQTLTVTDMAGRVVALPSMPRRIILLEARDIVGMALLHPDPGALIAGWSAVDRLDSDQLRLSLTEGRDIAIVGRQTPQTLSIEGILSQAPDLVVANLYMTPQGEDNLLVQRLEKVGIPVIFSDLSSNAASLADKASTPLSRMRSYMRMWGQILQNQIQAENFINFFETRHKRLATLLSGAEPVATYLEIKSTLDDCCWVAGEKIWGELLRLAGGITLDGVDQPWFQKLQLEYLISTPQDVYIASGGEWSSGGRPAIGPSLDSKIAQEGLQRLTERSGFAELSSIRDKRVHGIWTGLITMPPFNILFLECAAKWLHPRRCSSLDPNLTLAEMNRRFLSTPIQGPLWVSLQD